MSYQKCCLCKGKGLLKGEVCPVCLGERVINEDDGLPPSKHFVVSPWTSPYVPIYPVYPTYPITYKDVTGGTISFSAEPGSSTVTRKVYPSTLTVN